MSTCPVLAGALFAPDFRPHPVRQEKSRIARDRLVIDNLQMVDVVARSMMSRLPGSVEKDDLVSAGVMGLLDAAERFDATRPVRFQTYAELRIKGSILDYLRSLSWAPRGLHQRARQIETARASAEQKAGAAATAGELAAEMGLTTEEFHRLTQQVDGLQLVSLEEAMERDSAPRQGAFDHNRQAAGNPSGFNSSGFNSPDHNPLAELEKAQMKALVREALEGLPPRQRSLLELYYYEEMTLKQAGAALRVKESRACQIHSKAIASLRNKMAVRLTPRPLAKSAGPGPCARLASRDFSQVDGCLL